MPLAAGVAVAQALAGWGVAARLKWPNDVLVGERKLAGLLIEASSSGGALEQVILGIGVNLAVAPQVDQPGAQAPTSVRESLGHAPDVAAVGAAVLTRVMQWHGRSQQEPVAVRAAWRSLSVDWWGQQVEVRTSGSSWKGRLLELGEGGGLQIEREDGQRVSLMAGEVVRLRRAPLS